nr:MAG TPA: hypothetical protein [Crassvirales sp.]
MYDKAHPQLILEPYCSLPTFVKVTVLGIAVCP